MPSLAAGEPGRRGNASHLKAEFPAHEGQAFEDNVWTPPLISNKAFARPQLLQLLLLNATTHQVSILRGYAGGGKTLLASQAFHALLDDGYACTWLACEAADNEPGRFEARLTAALSNAERAPRSIPKDNILSGDAWRGNRDKLICFIDDYHLADETHQNDLIQRQLAAARGKLHVVISSRMLPGSSLGTLRFKQEVGEISPAQLSFTGSEIALLLGLSAQDAHRDEVKRLMRITEGWPAPCRFFANQMVATPTSKGLSSVMLTAGPDINAFLRLSLFEKLDPKLCDFMLDIAPLNAISSDLADEICGGPSGSLLLQNLVRACDLLIPLPDRPGWWRLHHLCMRYLREEAALRQPRRVGEVLKKASEWHATHMSWLSAAEYAMRAGETGEARHLIRICADIAFGEQGESRRLFRLYTKLPPNDPQSADEFFRRARAAIFAGVHEEAARLIETKSPDLNVPKAKLGSLKLWIDVSRGDLGDVRHNAGRILAQLDATDSVDRGAVAIALAIACHADLDVVAATKAVELARQELAHTSYQYLKALTALLSGVLAIDQGRPADAAAEMEGILRLETLRGPVRRDAMLVLAAAQYELGVDSHKLIAAGLEQELYDGITEAAYLGWRVDTRLRQRRGESVASLDRLREAEHGMARRYGEKGRRLIVLMRTEALLRQDQSGRQNPQIHASSALELEGWLKDSRTSKLFQERIKVILARLALAEGRPDDALALVQPIVAQSLAAKRHRAWGEASLVRAAALSALDKRDAALRQVLRVLEKLVPQRLSQLIIDETGLLRGLLPALSDHLKGLTAPDEAMMAIVGEMVGQAGLEKAATLPAPAAGRRRQVLLTATEVQALKLAATGLPNAEIASQMLISLPTVKWHLHNIFNKFSVRSRTAAISHARQAGFLD